MKITSHAFTPGQDAEIQAIRACVAAINRLDTKTKARVASYLADRFSE